MVLRVSSLDPPVIEFGVRAFLGMNMITLEKNTENKEQFRFKKLYTVIK